MEKFPPRTFLRRMKVALSWEAKDLWRSANLWAIPAALVLFSVFLLLGVSPIQKTLFASSITQVHQLGSLLAMQFLLVSLIVAITAGVSICRDYSQNRLRFLLVLPLSNTSLFLAKTITWCLFIPLYCMFWMGLINFAVFAIYHARGLPWAVEGVSMPPQLVLLLGARLVPGLLVSYTGIAAAAFLLGTIFRRINVVLVILVLSLVVSYITLPGLHVEVLPQTKIIG